MTQAQAISNYNALNGKTIAVSKLAAVGADLKTSLAEGGPLWFKIKTAHTKIERVVKSLKPTERIEVELTPITTEKKVVEKSPKVKRESKSPKPVKERQTSTKSSAGNFKCQEELEISKIKTDTKRFQNRMDSFSEASAQSVAENFDANKFDPIVVWKDKAGKIFVLSGHSRYEGMKRRKAKTIPVRYFKGNEEEAIKFARVEANRAANQESLVEDLTAYRLMRDGDKARNISKASKAELSRIFKGKSSKLEAYSFLNPNGLFIETLGQGTTSNYPYLERNAQWIGQLRKDYPEAISNTGEDNIFHFFYSDKSGKNLKLSKDEFFKQAKKRIAQLHKGESILFPECGSEGCKQSTDKENDPQRGDSYKRLREIHDALESIREKLTSKKANVRVTTDEEKKYLRTTGERLQAEKETIQKNLDIIDKSQASLFGLKGKQIAITDQGSKARKSKGKLNKLQRAQLQDSIKAGATVKINSGKGGSKKGYMDTPLFAQAAKERQTSLFGKKKGLGAASLSTHTAKQIPITGIYKETLIKLYSDTQILIWGMPGHGKTVWILLFAKYLAQELGLNVLVIENEEMISDEKARSTFVEKIKEFDIPELPNLTFVKYLPSDVSPYDVIIYDSINSIGFDVKQYRAYVDRNPGKIHVPIVQSTKDGDFRGGKDWEHEVDIAGEIKHRELVLRKNRLDSDLHKKRESIVMDDMVQEKKKHHTIKETVKEQLKREQEEQQDPYGFNYSNLGNVTIR